MKEYQYLIGKIIVAVAIIVAAIIIAQAIGGAGESIRSSLLQLREAIKRQKHRFHREKKPLSVWLPQLLS